MARNGSGTYSRAVSAYVFNTIIDQAAVNAEMDDIATALTASIAKDGQTTPTANLPMGTFRHTGVGNASARTDYASAGQVQDGKLNWVDGGGTADAITATYSPAITALVDGQVCHVRATAANATTTPTFAPSGLTARTIVKAGGGALVAGNIAADGHELILRYDLTNTRWELLNPVENALLKTGGTMTGTLITAKGADVASANALTLGADGNYFDITGTTSITSIATKGVGAWVRLHFDGALTLTHHNTDLILPGGANITTAAGDEAELIEYAAGDWRCVSYTKASGSALLGGAQIQGISASVGSSALTITAGTISLDFRSATLTSGTVTTVTGDPADLVISSGSTLGTVSGQQSRIAVLALNNAGTLELAAVNVAGGTSLTETGVISTTAEGGAGAADSATVVYSTSARTDVAYRVIGYVESTQATAGTWATAPSTIQGTGGNANTAMSSIGHGQTWQDVTGSRTFGSTYYNTTGKPIMVAVKNSLDISVTVGGVNIGGTVVTTNVGTMTFVVPPGNSYVVTGSSSSPNWAELR